MANYGFYVTGNGGRLLRFLDVLKGKKQGFLPGIGPVFVDHVGNANLRRCCGTLGIPYAEYDAAGFDRTERSGAISEALLKVLRLHTADYCFVFADTLLKGALLKQYAGRLINFHPSLLPAFKGLKAIDRAKEGKAFVLGNTAHFINESVDGGAVIMQSFLHHSFYHNYDDLLDMQVKMLVQIMIWIEERRLCFPNDGYAIVEGADYRIGNYVPALENKCLSFFEG